VKAGVVLISAIAALLCTATTAHADIRIHAIFYNPPGSDTQAKLNQEWVSIHNYGKHPKSLGRWTLRDHQHHVYTFPSAFTLCGGCSAKVHTGSGSNTASNLYWGSGSYIWNNTGDIAGLRNSAGTLVDRCAYAGGGAEKIC
jgi:hypothetical protein